MALLQLRTITGHAVCCRSIGVPFQGGIGFFGALLVREEACIAVCVQPAPCFVRSGSGTELATALVGGGDSSRLLLLFSVLASHSAGRGGAAGAPWSPEVTACPLSARAPRKELHPAATASVSLSPASSATRASGIPAPTTSFLTGVAASEYIDINGLVLQAVAAALPLPCALAGLTGFPLAVVSSPSAGGESGPNAKSS